MRSYCFLQLLVYFWRLSTANMLPQLETLAEFGNGILQNEKTFPSLQQIPTAQEAHKWMTIKSSAVRFAWSNRFSMATNKAVTAYSLSLHLPGSQDAKVASSILHDTEYLHHTMTNLHSNTTYEGDLEALVGAHKWPYKLLNFTLQTPTMLDGYEMAKLSERKIQSDISDFESIKMEIILRWSEAPFKTDGIGPDRYVLKLWRKENILREEILTPTNEHLGPKKGNQYQETLLSNLPLDQIYKVSLEGQRMSDQPSINLAFNLITGTLQASESVFETGPGGVAGCFSALQIKCPKSDRCVSPYWICDGSEDCPDGEDEDGCNEVKPCDHGFRCWESKHCLPVSWRCDGYEDCRDGEDELGCSNCGGSELLRCGTGNDCVSLGYACDGQKQCPDGWDETDAVCNHVISSIEADTFINTMGCPENEILCGLNGGCIYETSVCDGISDCPTSEDELPLLCNFYFKNKTTFNTEADSEFISTKKLENSNISLNENEALKSDTEKITVKLNTTDSTISRTTTLSPSYSSTENDLQIMDATTTDKPLVIENINGSDSILTTYSYLKVLSNTSDTATSTTVVTNSTSTTVVTNSTTTTAQSAINSTSAFPELALSTKNLISKEEDNNMENLTTSKDEDNTMNIPDDLHILPAQFVNGLESASLTRTTTGSPPKKFRCPGDEFDCGDGWCVPLFWLCDGRFDCMGGEDEDPETCKRISNGEDITFDDNYVQEEVLANNACPEHQFQCLDGHCIDTSKLCDGYYDCSEQEDELTCGTTSAKAGTDFDYEGYLNTKNKKGSEVTFIETNNLHIDNLDGASGELSGEKIMPQDPYTQVPEIVQLPTVSSVATSSFISAPSTELSTDEEDNIHPPNETTTLTTKIYPTEKIDVKNIASKSLLHEIPMLANEDDKISSEMYSSNEPVVSEHSNHTLSYKEDVMDDSSSILLNSTLVFQNQVKYEEFENGIENYTEKADNQSLPFNFHTKENLTLPTEKVFDYARTSTDVSEDILPDYFEQNDDSFNFSKHENVKTQNLKMNNGKKTQENPNDKLAYVEEPPEKSLRLDENGTQPNLTLMISGTTSQDGFLVLSTSSNQQLSNGSKTILIAIDAGPLSSDKLPELVIHNANGTQYKYEVIQVIDKPLKRNKSEIEGSESSPKYLLEKVITFRLEGNGRLNLSPNFINSSSHNSKVHCIPKKSSTKLNQSSIFFINQIIPSHFSETKDLKTFQNSKEINVLNQLFNTTTNEPEIKTEEVSSFFDNKKENKSIALDDSETSFKDKEFSQTLENPTNISQSLKELTRSTTISNSINLTTETTDSAITEEHLQKHNSTAAEEPIYEHKVIESSTKNYLDKTYTNGIPHFVDLDITNSIERNDHVKTKDSKKRNLEKFQEEENKKHKTDRRSNLYEKKSHFDHAMSSFGTKKHKITSLESNYWTSGEVFNELERKDKYLDTNNEIDNDLSPIGYYEDSNLIEPMTANQIDIKFKENPKYITSSGSYLKFTYYGVFFSLGMVVFT